MGRLLNGIFGGFSGKVGDAEGYVINGVNYIRGKKKIGKRKRRPKTVAQSKMCAVNAFIDSMTDFAGEGFRLAVKGKLYNGSNMNKNNAAKSYQLNHAITGIKANWKIDYSAVRLTEGNLSPALSPTVTSNNEGIRFNWEYNPRTDFETGSNQVMVLVYCPASNQSFYTLYGAHRSTGTYVLEIPPTLKGMELETYISFITEDRNSIANSVYTGKIISEATISGLKEGKTVNTTITAEKPVYRFTWKRHTIMTLPFLVKNKYVT
ncbi:DUF6266 family protein [Pedobacter metabolipauper]|uniref:Uncharacterized protein n=1 Tax=Pedobacter metabolipauper TaxID=425513 RepID=A0A4R6SQ47_9SPHI|nr:DUF6266 family protein [Pedobacter metabolipauper]TDQ06184.1 hypothetical protein ATK78_4565 [Pedobacter metabolipauper]